MLRWSFGRAVGQLPQKLGSLPGAYRETQKGGGRRKLRKLYSFMLSLTKCPKKGGEGEGPSPLTLCTPMEVTLQYGAIVHKELFQRS